MVSNIVEGLKGFTLGREQSDDITMLAVRFRP
jgi:serine phosphatase RsbU (regulator of sigma subunit)